MNNEITASYDRWSASTSESWEENHGPDYDPMLEAWTVCAENYRMDLIEAYNAIRGLRRTIGVREERIRELQSEIKKLKGDE